MAVFVPTHIRASVSAGSKATERHSMRKASGRACGDVTAITTGVILSLPRRVMTVVGAREMAVTARRRLLAANHFVPSNPNITDDARERNKIQMQYNSKTRGEGYAFKDVEEND